MVKFMVSVGGWRLTLRSSLWSGGSIISRIESSGSVGSLSQYVKNPVHLASATSGVFAGPSLTKFSSGPLRVSITASDQFSRDNSGSRFNVEGTALSGAMSHLYRCNHNPTFQASLKPSTLPSWYTISILRGGSPFKISSQPSDCAMNFSHRGLVWYPSVVNTPSVSFNFRSASAARSCCSASVVSTLCCAALASAASFSKDAVRPCCSTNSFFASAAAVSSVATWPRKVRLSLSNFCARSFAFCALSLACAALFPASAIRALASPLTASWYLFPALHTRYVSSATINALATRIITYAANSLLCALSASSIGDVLDWLADRLDWTVAIALTILANGLSVIAALAIRDRLKRSKTIKRRK